VKFLYDCYHNLAVRIKYGKWLLLLLPILFCVIGFYVELNSQEWGAIRFKKFAVENALMPLAFFAVGFLFPVSFFRRYPIRFSGEQRVLWNKDGFSWAFFLLLFAVTLQIAAIWGDKSWDRVPVDGVYYTEDQLREQGKYNEVTQLKRQLSVFSRPFQVGEFVKIFLMIFMAKIITDMRIRGQIKFCNEFFAFPLLAFLTVGFLTYRMPNYSMLAIFAALIFLMMFLQDMDFKLRALLITFIAIPIAVAVSISNLDSGSVQRHGVNRIWAFFNEEGTGNNQQNEALQALADGGITGKGLSGGTIKLRLFGARNDFAYAALGEELGMWLMLPITIAMSGFLFACFWVASSCSPKDNDAIFAQNLALGIAIIFTLNIFLHIGVNLRLLPNTGQPLSFVSSGGANLAANFFLVGMLVQISSLNREAA
jgi:rod shape determining protein RodA